MGPYIYGARNGIHIMDLTHLMLDDALKIIRDTVAKGAAFFVGTASGSIADR
jgi:small subunit ribosomal protein S2